MVWKKKTNLKEMNVQLKHIFFCLGLIFCLAGQSYANDATDAYQKEALNTEAFDAKTWQSASDGMQYSRKPKAKKKRKRRPSSNGTPPRPIDPPNPGISFRDFAQTVLIFLAVLVLAFVIFKAVAGDAILVNKEVTRRKPVTLSEIETNLHEADVEGFLKQSLEQEDYRLAVRLYYLAIIKELSIKGAIEWKKDKTNGHYLREMRKSKHPSFQAFKNVTRIFEYVWYSNMNFDGGQFEEVRVNFKDLLATIK